MFSHPLQKSSQIAKTPPFERHRLCAFMPSILYTIFNGAGEALGGRVSREGKGLSLSLSLNLDDLSCLACHHSWPFSSIGGALRLRCALPASFQSALERLLAEPPNRCQSPPWRRTCASPSSPSSPSWPSCARPSPRQSRRRACASSSCRRRQKRRCW